MTAEGYVNGSVVWGGWGCPENNKDAGKRNGSVLRVRVKLVLMDEFLT